MQGIKCDICGKNFATPKSLKEHTKEQHLSDKIRCEICQRLVVPRRLKQHMLDAHGEPVKCKICGKMFSSKMRLQSHTKNQHQSHCCACNICGLSLSSYQSLERHVQAMHSDKSRSRVTCEFCNHSILAERLKQHLRRVHQKVPSQKESIPNQDDQQVTEEFKRHLEDEQDQNEVIPNQDFVHIVACVVCSLTFSKPEDLVKHITEHHSGYRGKIIFS